MMDVYSSMRIQARVIPKASLTRQHPIPEAEKNYLLSRNNINYPFCPTYHHYFQPLSSPKQKPTYSKNDDPTSLSLSTYNLNFDAKITLSNPHKTPQSPSSTHTRNRSPCCCHITYKACKTTSGGLLW
jgi:hypothetical protein